MKKQHPYSWLASRIRKLHPYVSIYNNKPGGVLIYEIGTWEKGGQGVLFIEDHFLKAIRHARKNQPSKKDMANFNIKVEYVPKHAPNNCAVNVQQWNINNNDDAVEMVEHQYSVHNKKSKWYKIYINGKLHIDSSSRQML